LTGSYYSINDQSSASFPDDQPLTMANLPKQRIYKWYLACDIIVSGTAACKVNVIFHISVVNGYSNTAPLRVVGIDVPNGVGQKKITRALIPIDSFLTNSVTQITVDASLLLQQTATGSMTALQAGGTVGVQVVPSKVVGKLSKIAPIGWADISFQNVNGGPYLSLSSGFDSWIPYFGKCFLNGSDDPNASIQAIFKSTIQAVENNFNKGLTVLILWDASQQGGLAGALNNIYIGLGLTGGIGSLVPVGRWLSSSGPFGGMTTMQIKDTFYQLMKDFTNLRDCIAAGALGQAAIVDVFNMGAY